MVRLIALLGNKGIQYSKTRHNVAWICGELWDCHWNSLSGWQSKFHAEWKPILWNSQKIVLLKPMTFMNVSGTSISEASNYFDIPPEEILVVHDDIELPFKNIKLQSGGGLAGHNGLRSIRQQIKSDQFLRLRIGIGRPSHQDIASYVLARFNPEEEVFLPRIADMGRQLIDQFINNDCNFTNIPNQVQL